MKIDILIGACCLTNCIIFSSFTYEAHAQLKINAFINVQQNFRL